MLGEVHKEDREFRALPLVRGSTVHRMIELWYAYGRPPITSYEARGLFEAALEDTLNLPRERHLPVAWETSGGKADYIKQDCPLVTNILLGFIQNFPHDVLQPIPRVIEGEFSFDLGRYPVEGKIDYIFPTHAGGMALVDVKTNQGQAPSPWVLRYGNQFGLYAAAMLQSGEFTIEETGVVVELEKRLPERIYWVHVRDFDPYARESKSDISKAHPDRVAWAEREGYVDWDKGKIIVPKGGMRGPGWYGTTRTEEDVEAFTKSAARICQAIKMQIFPQKVDVQTCGACDFRKLCLDHDNGNRDNLNKIAANLARRDLLEQDQ